MKAKRFKWPKEIYFFWMADFILGIELIGPALLIFFKDWGGLNQTETQLLQSWFTLWIFILEVPTGVIGDIKGKKSSVLIGYLLTAFGAVIYTFTPNIFIFFLAEFVFAAGVAFISGSKEAWMYDITKENKIENGFREVYLTSNSLHMAGMILASVLFIWVSNILPVNIIFRIGAISNVVAVMLLGVFVKGVDSKQDKSLKPNYLETIVKGLGILKGSMNLRKLAIYAAILSSTSYFVIWLYQEALRVLEVPNSMFGTYRIVLLAAEILVLRFSSILFKKFKVKNALFILAFLVGIGFIIGGTLTNVIGTMFVLALAGGIGLQINTLISKDINEEIDSKQRATVLSFVGMVRRLMLTIFNPFIGLLVDSKGVFISFSVLGVISLLAMFFKPKS